MASIPVEIAYRYCPTCAEPNKTIGAIPFKCDQCGHACFFGPVAAVGALIEDSQNRLLFVRRARDPGKGKWGLPGGFVDRNESVEEALVREVREETQLAVTECRYLMSGPNNYQYQGVISAVIDLFFVCRIQSADGIAIAKDELERYIWAEPQEQLLNDMAFSSNRRAVEAWMQLRS
ncbi:MAG: NUDIX domain-containing protein [Planctomycetales bacterium]|nr:NUDIX domain-containing protein [Planctomycetales bacterium]